MTIASGTIIIKTILLFVNSVTSLPQFSEVLEVTWLSAADTSLTGRYQSHAPVVL
jgi:hypothetical protein